MTIREVIYFKGEKLTDHRPRQQPSAAIRNEAYSPEVEPEARVRAEGSGRFFKGRETTPQWACISAAIG